MILIHLDNIFGVREHLLNAHFPCASSDILLELISINCQTKEERLKQKRQLKYFIYVAFLMNYLGTSTLVDLFIDKMRPRLQKQRAKTPLKDEIPLRRHF